MYIRPLALLTGLGLSHLVSALSAAEQCITFPSTELDESFNFDSESQAVFGSQKINHLDDDFVIASKPHKHTTPILLDSQDNEAIHVAAQTFADDVYKVTGLRPELYNDTLPKTSPHAIIVGSVSSRLIEHIGGDTEYVSDLEGKWESFDIRVTKKPLKGIDEGLIVVGSDRVSLTFALC